MTAKKNNSRKSKKKINAVNQVAEKMAKIVFAIKQNNVSIKELVDLCIRNHRETQRFFYEMQLSNLEIQLTTTWPSLEQREKIKERIEDIQELQKFDDWYKF